jgi:citrate synthase
VTSAVAALQGPKHGGANEDVAAMLEEVGDPAGARAWAEAKLARYRAMTSEERKAPGARFAGFGHRVYKVDDPRAVVLRALALESAGDARTAVAARRALETAEAVREVVQSGLGLVLNVDYYSAIVYAGLGIEPAMFTSIFAASRVVGWCAHVMEQHANNRLIRPRAAYVGPAPRNDER